MCMNLMKFEVLINDLLGYCKLRRIAVSSMYLLSEGMSDCCLTPTQQFFSYIMAKKSLFSMK